jgi:hypothetical protein
MLAASPMHAVETDGLAYGVVDGEPSGDHAPGAVDTDVDVLVRVFRGQEEQRRHDD